QTNNMKNILTIASLLLLAACGNAGKDQNALLTEKKAQMDKLKDQEQKLQAEIDKLDTSKKEKPKLVAIATVAPETFTHYIDLQGKVESDNIGYIAPRTNGGQVRSVFVKRGDIVHKGQLLLKLDDAVAQKTVAGAEQAVAIAKANAALQASLYQKRKNLWDQNIGSEVEVITQRTQMETAEAQQKSAEEQLKQAKEQLSFTNVISDIDGQVEVFDVRPGEFFSPQSAATQIRIVNTNNLKVTAQVPENYLGRVKTGTDVKVELPDAGKTINTKVRVAGTAIDPTSHGFFVESRLPADKSIRPNQVAMVKILDYTVNNAITAPVNALQSDEKGKYIMVAVKEGSQLRARKRTVIPGEFYGDKLEIKSGLQSGDLVITDGFQSLYDGQLLTTDAK
ncbi:MAG: efflux RND transporter periplasmic adaptor subunit, partial [Bacteroidetes bacterium]|nr:efflux RND transporter periplasmic adaptor subunit [Bacteroidota bacterium]